LEQIGFEILVFSFEIRNCPTDSHPSGGFPVSQFAI
jgi:hypothetical protein